MKLLVTGGAGYVGSVVTAELLAHGHDVVVLDNLSTGHADALPERARVLSGDVRTDAAAVLGEGGFEGILHFAAKSLVGESMTDPESYWEVNVAGTLALVRAAVAAGVPRFVFSSSAAVYGEPEQLPIREDAPPRPTNPYGATKLAIDLMLAGVCPARGLGAVSLRYFNVGGAVGRYGERHAHETHLVPLVLSVAAGDREGIDVYGEDWPTPDGTCIRDYIHVADLARAHRLALDACAPGRHEVVNLGTGTGYSVRQVLETAERVVGRPIPARVSGRRPGDPAVLVAAADKARDLLGWQPTLGLEQIIADAWAFARTRRTQTVTRPAG